MMSQAVQYMARTRAYYEAQGFEIPYTWAHFDKIPFTPLVRPLRESRVALITTAALYDRDADDVREVAIQTTSEIPERLYANDLSWDRQATHLNDLGSYFPLEPLKRLVRDRRIGSICTNFIAHQLNTVIAERWKQTLQKSLIVVSRTVPTSRFSFRCDLSAIKPCV